MEPDIRKIIRLINANGRQGPKDLQSEEVYHWVRMGLDIEYSDYIELLKKNMIREAEREKSRDFYFVSDSAGRIQLFKSTEEEIRKYLCYIVRENPDITSHEAIARFKILYPDYTLVDLMEQQNLSAHQAIIDQTVRNVLVSNYGKEKNQALFYRTAEKPYRYTLKPGGAEPAEEIARRLTDAKKKNEECQSLADSRDDFAISGDSSIYTDEELAKIALDNKDFDVVGMIGQNRTRDEKYSFPTDPKIRATRLFQAGYRCECDPAHITFPTVTVSNFLEGHHLVPMAAQRNFQSVKLDCIENMVALCPICHSRIHYGTREAKRFVFDRIVEKRKAELMKLGLTDFSLNEIFEAYY